MAGSSSILKNTVTLRAVNVEIEEDYDLVMESKTIEILLRQKLSESSSDGIVDLSSVPGDLLTKVLSYAKKHRNSRLNPDSQRELEALNSEFFKEDKDTVLMMVNLIHYLDFEEFFKFIVKAVADHIKGMEVEQVRKFFNIENDHSPDYEANIRKKYDWAFNAQDNPNDQDPTSCNI